MREAWGTWEGRGREFQIDLNPQRWADYPPTNRAKVRALIGYHTLYIWDELRRRAEFVFGACEFQACEPRA